MPINTEQYKNQGLSGQDRKAIVEANLKRLDYAEGNGLLSKAKKNCCRGSCIFYQLRRNGTKGTSQHKGND